MKYPKCAEDLVNNAPSEAQVYLRDHNPLKVRLTILFSRFLRYSFEGEKSENADVIGLSGAVVFNNIDEIIDDGVLADNGSKKSLVRHFAMLLGGECSSLSLPEVDPLKLKELEYLCSEIRNRITSSVGNEIYFDVFSDLAEVVIQQIDRRFDEFRTPEKLTPLVQPLDDFIEKYNLPTQVINRLRLALRMGAYTAAILAPISLVDRKKDRQALFFFGAAAQMLDDLCDISDDIEKGQDTFAVEASQRENSKELIQVLKKIKNDLFVLADQSVETLPSKLRLRLFRRVFEIFSLLNSSETLRKIFNSKDRLGLTKDGAGL